MDGWCGATALWPCRIYSGAAGVLLVASVIGALVQSRASRRWAAALASSSQHRAAASLAGREFGALIAHCSLLAVHTAFTIAASVLRLPPYLAASQLCLAVVWLVVAASALSAARQHHAAYRALRPVLAAAPALYTYSAAALILQYVSGGTGLPVVFLRLLIWFDMVGAALAVLALAMELSQATAAATAAAAAGLAPGAAAGGGAYQPLPASDIEAPGAGTAAAGAAGKDEGEPPRTWISLFVGACRFAWPRSPGLRLRVLGCVCLLLLMRVLNLAVPVAYKRLVDVLADASAAPAGRRPSFVTLLEPWALAYLLLIVLQGGAGGGVTGLINNARSWLWIGVSQDAYRRVSLDVFSHVLDLDLDFHLKRKTGEVSKVLDRGCGAMQNVLSTVLFSIVPQIVDVLVASTYLAAALEPWVALIVFVTVGSYIPLTIAVTEWRAGFRRSMNASENQKSARLTDALLNWETVKYFTNEPLEVSQYAEAISGYQGAEYSFLSSLNVLNVVQSGIMMGGIAAGTLACTAGVAQGSLSVGDVVLFLSLMSQLYGPLNFFGTYYRIIQQYMIDLENLLALLETKGRVADAPGARALALAGGAVEFRSVQFAYTAGGGPPVLKGVSFKAPGGSTLALVGATGSGKSTAMRLLFRFFDVCDGAILIDGQDLRSVTQDSLRRALGVVPQDVTLFNASIMYNIRYGRPGASEAEVHAAARAACIHDAIVERFPQGYDTIVGERGLRLSGGEKQRVALARALLKDPAVCVFDEATASLDSVTEKQIQAALEASRSNRTTFIVAHRLSTIVHADCIVVLREGRVAEAGTHAQLLEQGGLYAEMWNKQVHQPQPGQPQQQPDAAAEEQGTPPAPQQAPAAATNGSVHEAAGSSTRPQQQPAAGGAPRHSHHRHH